MASSGLHFLAIFEAPRTPQDCKRRNRRRGIKSKAPGRHISPAFPSPLLLLLCYEENKPNKKDPFIYLISYEHVILIQQQLALIYLRLGRAFYAQK